MIQSTHLGKSKKIWSPYKGQNAQFNLTNHRLATQWIIERWRAVERWRVVRKNPTPGIGQIKVVGKIFGNFHSPGSNDFSHINELFDSLNFGTIILLSMILWISLIIIFK